ncbi:TPA: septum formation initiator [Klebsiella pneumoniae]|nr:septum formation initiator [Klebsiella pneumoniae]
MNTENIIINKGYSDPAKWHSEDTVWVLGLFGTAIGAGVLFLPINAGIGGFWPLLIVFVLAFPITYLAHRGLARFIYSSNTPESSITDVIGEHFGALAGKVFTVIYFFAVYTILIMYAVAITNTAQSFITHQLAMAEPPRSLVAIVLILGLMFIVRFGQRLIMRVTSTLVYPFIISLIFMALFLIPHWNGAILQTVSFSATGDGQGIMLSLWMTFPVLVMSFNHYPIISPMVVRQKQRYGLALAEGKCAQIQRYGILLMTVVVLFFVLSCVLSLSPQQLAEAKAQNLSILSYLANQYDTPIIAWLSPIIAFVAITKSFLGHYIGAYESLRDLILEAAAARGKKPGIRLVDAVILVFMVLTCWFAAYKNPSILGIIECISGPTGAAILLLLPMYAIHKLPVLAPWRGKASNVFVTLIGLITVSAIFYGMFQ